jgi:uncharacterized protein DUF4105
MSRIYSSVITVYRTLRPVYLFFAAVILFSFRPVAAMGNDAYVDVLAATAREMNLQSDRYWDVLLHYKRSGSGKKSLIDDPRFFLAPDGKTNPSAELEATIRGFFREAEPGDDHPRCRFAARYAWLKERLDIDESKLPPAACRKLDEALTLINPKSAVLVFPAAHGNGPASMFGHTLLRIDGTFKSDLLSYAVNYAAFADDTNGLLYAFKGTFGFYKGFYSILPYYEKVKEYSDMDHRDIWEYALNLSEEETRSMVLHVWELQNIYSDYYYFDENCSYNLLFLIEAGRPAVDMTGSLRDGARFWVIPSDTIRAVMDSGLVVGAKYRPSQATRIRSISSHLDKDGQTLSLAVLDRKISPQTATAMVVAPEEKREILDLSTEMLQYRYSRKEIEKDDYLELFLAVLNNRSTLGSNPPEFYAPPVPVQPEEGHRSGRFGTAGGYAGRDSFMEMEWRAAYHDILDPDEGYIEGAEIRFFDLSGRYYFKENRVRLQKLHFIDIVSLSPRDNIFQPTSWKMSTGFDRKLMRSGEESLMYRINPGGGVSYRSDLLGLAYFMLESDLELSNKFRDRYSFGIGPSGGLLKTIAGPWKANLSARSLYYELGEKHRSAIVSLTQNFKISTNNSLQFSLSREKTFDRYQSEAKLTWNLYF